MRTPLVLSLAAFLACGASVAQAADSALLAGFKQLCVAHQGDADSIRAAALQEGWTIEPATPKVSGMDVVVVLTKALDVGAKMDVLLGRGQHRMGDVTIGGNFCVIAAQAQDGGAISAAVSEWAGVPPTQQGWGARTIYTFTDDPDGHHPISKQDPATWNLLAHDGKVVGVSSRTAPNGVTSISYFHSVAPSGDLHPH